MVLLLEAVSAVLTFSFWFLKGQVTCILCLCRKQCVQTFNVFDFLKDIVSKVPDLGGSVANGDDHTVKRRCALVNTLVSWNQFQYAEFLLFYIRKVAEDDNDNHEEPKRSNRVIYQSTVFYYFIRCQHKFFLGDQFLLSNYILFLIL